MATSTPSTVADIRATQREEQARRSNDPADRRYAALVEKRAEEWRRHNKAGLSFYHSTGGDVSDLCEGGEAKYGARTVETFAKDLRKAGADSVSLSQLYKSRRFHTLFNESDLKKLTQAGWSWRNISFLIADQIPDNTRRSILQRVERGQMRQADVRKVAMIEVPELVRKGKRMNQSVSSFLTRAASGTNAYRDSLALMPKVLAKLRAYKPNARAAFKEQVTQLRAELDAADKCIREQRKALDDLAI